MLQRSGSGVPSPSRRQLVEILIINFSLNGISDAQYRDQCDEVAPAFAAVPGLLSKVWLADPANGVYGGVYTFRDTQAVDAYLASDLMAHVAGNPAFVDVTARRFAVLSAPTAVTRGLAVAAV
jgi:hypothetical protein